MMMKEFCCLVVYLYCCLLSVTLSTNSLSTLYVRVPQNCSDEFKDLCEVVLRDEKYEISDTPCCINDTDGDDDLQMKHNTTLRSYKNFKTLLNRTVIGVFLLESNKNRCMDSYKRWLCFTRYEFYDNPNCTNNTLCKPSIAVCNRVVQNCPYYTPARYQSDASSDGSCTQGRMREVVYGGLPAFMCPSKDNKARDDKYEYDGESADDVKFVCNNSTT